MKTVTIPASFYEKNRSRISHYLKTHSLAIFHSNDEMNRSADQYFPYRQNSDLFYLCGINQEKTILLLFPDHPDVDMKEILFIRNSNKKLETWEGHKLTIDEARSISGINNVKWFDEYDSVIAECMMLAECVYLNLPEHPKFIPEVPCRNLRLNEKLRSNYPAHNYERLASLMRNLRSIKLEEEIALITEACRITREGFIRTLKAVRPGIMEFEIEAELTYEFLKQGARGHAYQPIVASGINACVLHYIQNDLECKKGDLLLMDFGAEYGNYAADCSRTIPVSGRFTARQKEIYNSVLDVLKYAQSLMKPGASINIVHAETCKKLEKEHIKLGLYSAKDLENQDPKNPLYQQFYMHGTSHFLGLDVHDVGRKDAEFRPGMVLTCEPGIYIPAEKIGIRLENNILITDNTNINLMRDIPIEPDEIEALMDRK